MTTNRPGSDTIGSDPTASAAAAPARVDQLVKLAFERIPGGVSTNIRLEEGPQKLLVESAEGCHIRTVDGREFIDYVCGYGSVLLGYGCQALTERQIQTLQRGVGFNATSPFEIEAADHLVKIFPDYDMVRLCTTGSEATTAAIGLARSVSQRNSIVVFKDHYHGWHGPTLATRTAITGQSAEKTYSGDHVFELPFNDPQVCQDFFQAHGSKIACVIFEIVSPTSAARDPDKDFVQHLHQARDRDGFLLIADEVVTGFRLGLGGAQVKYGFDPDITVFGKALGGGIPVGAVIGKRQHMSLFANGKAVHAGTFNGHALAVASTCAMLDYLSTHETAVYEQLYRQGQRLAAGLSQAAADTGHDWAARGPGPFFWFGPGNPTADVPAQMLQFFNTMLSRGVRIPQGGRWFIGTAHTDEAIDRTIEAAQQTFSALPAS